MSQKPIKVKAILPDGVELDLNGPDLSKTKRERPLVETGAALERANEDVNAVEAIRSARWLTYGMP